MRRRSSFPSSSKSRSACFDLPRELRALRPLVVTGGMDQRRPQRRIRFLRARPSRRVMVLSLRAGGTGLNLTAASRVIHFDRWWNPAVESQAEDRVHRIGQTRPVEVFAYLCSDTVEERIANILDEKRALFSDLIDGVPASSLGRLDLDALLRAAAPAFLEHDLL